MMAMLVATNVAYTTHLQCCRWHPADLPLSSLAELCSTANHQLQRFRSNCNLRNSLEINFIDE